MLLLFLHFFFMPFKNKMCSKCKGKLLILKCKKNTMQLLSKVNYPHLEKARKFKNWQKIFKEETYSFHFLDVFYWLRNSFDTILSILGIFGFFYSWFLDFCFLLLLLTEIFNHFSSNINEAQSFFIPNFVKRKG